MVVHVISVKKMNIQNKQTYNMRNTFDWCI